MRVRLSVEDQDESEEAGESQEGPLSRAQLDKLRRSYKVRRAEVKRLARGDPRTEADKKRYRQTGRIIALLEASDEGRGLMKLNLTRTKCVIHIFMNARC
jgi:hypothetical protein